MADDTTTNTDDPITIEVTGNGPPETDISDTVEGTVTVEANKPSPWPLLIALAIGAWIYFGHDEDELNE